MNKAGKDITVKVSQEVRDRLAKVAHPGQSVDGVLRDLLKMPARPDGRRMTPELAPRSLKEAANSHKRWPVPQKLAPTTLKCRNRKKEGILRVR